MGRTDEEERQAGDRRSPIRRACLGVGGNVTFMHTRYISFGILHTKRAGWHGNDSMAQGCARGEGSAGSGERDQPEEEVDRAARGVQQQRRGLQQPSAVKSFSRAPV